jgi:hypothetical protein
MNVQNYQPVKLFLILSDLVARAKLVPHAPQTKFLARGLRIEVTYDNQDYHLRIWRNSGVPSVQEWETCLKNWPWKTNAKGEMSMMAVPPFIHGRIKDSAEVQEKFF